MCMKGEVVLVELSERVIKSKIERAFDALSNFGALNFELTILKSYKPGRVCTEWSVEFYWLK